MRELLDDVFEPNRRNVLTAAGVAGLLFVAYVVYPTRILQYGVRLVIFTVWMVWFVYAGVEYVYGIDS
jgi:homoserine trans-succinylase